MSETDTVTVLGVDSPGQLYFWSYPEESLGDGQFRVETLYSGLSAGTELTFFKGTNPYLQARWDEDYGVFVPGQPSQCFPVRFLGYMEVGRVTESRTPAVVAGEMLAMRYGHKTGHTADPCREFYEVLPPDLDPLLGIYVAQMGPICANGLLHAAADRAGPNVRGLGDGVRDRRVLVTGGGVVGLLIGLFARHHGAASVVVADETPARLTAARGLGLDAIDESRVEVWRYCKERWVYGPGDRGADLVFQCRAQAASLRIALRSLRPQGTVIDLAFYQGGAEQVRLGEEFHHNGLRICCAQIGRVPRELGEGWDHARLARETVELLQAHGRAIRTHLITDIVPFADAPTVVAALGARQRHAIQVVFQVSV